MTNRIHAGIGARATPAAVLADMTKMAGWLARTGSSRSQALSATSLRIRESTGSSSATATRRIRRTAFFHGHVPTRGTCPQPIHGFLVQAAYAQIGHPVLLLSRWA